MQSETLWIITVLNMPWTWIVTFSLSKKSIL